MWASNIDALFFILGWDQYGLHKRRARSRYTKHVFLNLVGYAGHIVHSGVSGARNIDTIFIMLDWDRYRFNKKCVRTSYPKFVFLHPVGSVGHVGYFGSSRMRNVDALFFMLCWDHYSFHKNNIGTRYAELLFFHLVGAAGHVVHSGASDTLFFMLGRIDTDLTKCASGKVIPNLCFCIRWHLWVTYCIPVRVGTKHRCTIFYAWVGPVRIAQKTRQNTLRHTCLFESSGIYGSRSAFRGTKCRHNIYHARLGLIQI
jgi:hypothetical protein